MNEDIDKLKGHTAETKAEFDGLQSEIDAIPGQLAEIDRRLKTSTDEAAIRSFRKKREQLKEDQEIKPLLAKGAQIRYLRAEAAYCRVLEQQVGSGYKAALAAEREAKAELELATAKVRGATQRREQIERRSGNLSGKAQTLSARADELERGTARAA